MERCAGSHEPACVPNKLNFKGMIEPFQLVYAKIELAPAPAVAVHNFQWASCLTKLVEASGFEDN